MYLFQCGQLMLLRRAEISSARMQGLGHMFARNVKVSLEEMRQRQTDAAGIVLRRQLAFLRDGVLPDKEDPDVAVAPIGQDGCDEQSYPLAELPALDGEPDAPGTPGQMRLRRLIKYPKGTPGATTRTIYIVKREDIFALNGLCEKWVRCPAAETPCITAVYLNSTYECMLCAAAPCARLFQTCLRSEAERVPHGVTLCIGSAGWPE
ncbi:MAG: hypothetical protein HC872_04460 [Gammaproteobacteria bacterium]|nr:hypothetical protein [Gammaproteobacteria bacterium]